MIMQHPLIDKIENILDNHRVAAPDYNKLKEDLLNTFLENQLLVSTKLGEVPDDFVDFMKKSKISKPKETYNAIYKWITTTPEGEKWVRSVLNISKDVLTTNLAIQYNHKDGSKHSLNPTNTFIYFREKPKKQGKKKKGTGK